jgi:hypothetical protein
MAVDEWAREVLGKRALDRRRLLILQVVWVIYVAGASL